MTRLALSPQAWRDIERLAEFLIESDPANASRIGELLISGLEVLELHPLIGREVEHGLRELLISRGRSGYAALYRYHEAADTALILTLSHQRESGFPSMG
ncbi:MAG TPA: type II toxin-antitoxin system RelE/ParE family toxin [Pseudoxanthomonas sp.]|nr:type II toxin-antitoxin system RelE/ParE family toxin [Pseudoxanthomonas sp.]